MSLTLIGIYAFIGGTIYGSFLNALRWRLPYKKSMGGRSACRSCHHILRWYDLVPIVSYTVLAGKCRYCKARIHFSYPLIELSAGILFLLYALYHPPGTWVHILLWGYAVAVFFALMVFDIQHMILPDSIVLPAIFIVGIYGFFTTPLYATALFPTGLLLAAFFAILYIGSRGRWLGFGDVKLALLIGFLFGYPMAVIVVLGGIWSAALVAIVLLALRKARSSTPLPFGAFLSGVALSAILFYDTFQLFADYIR